MFLWMYVMGPLPVTAAASFLDLNAPVAKQKFGDDGFHMMVLPANRVVDFQEVRLTLGLSHARLATEDELNRLFPDCELGAMPPMGNLYGMPVYADESLAEQEEITFNAGTHRELVRMAWTDLVQLVDPKTANLTHRRPPAVAA